MGATVAAASFSTGFLSSLNGLAELSIESAAFGISPSFFPLSTVSLSSSTSPLKHFNINANRRSSAGFTLSQFSTLCLYCSVIGLGFTNEMLHSSFLRAFTLGAVDVFECGTLKSVSFGLAGSVGCVFSATSGTTTFSIGFGTVVALGVSIIAVSVSFSVCNRFACGGEIELLRESSFDRFKDCDSM